MDMSGTKILNGKKYYLYRSTPYTKAEANYLAKALRNRGKSVRIISFPRKHYVYYRD